MDNGRQDNMPRRRYTPEEIIGKLREAEVLLSQGQSVGQAARALAISEQTYYRPAHIAGPSDGARSMGAFGWSRHSD
jgi:hypothetical protein